MMSYAEWLTMPAYVNHGLQQGTMEEVTLHFFYDGVSPWVTSTGYNWSDSKDAIAKRFLHFCYTVQETLRLGSKYTLITPSPRHRNYEEDRETFDYFLDTPSFIDLLDAWSFREEIVGTHLDYLIKEFCYVWIDVTSGNPGAFTQKLFNAEDEDSHDEEFNSVPDTWSKKKWDLY